MTQLPTMVHTLLQAHWKMEMANSMRYSAMSSWSAARGLDNTKKFFSSEAHDELKHARKVQKYLEKRGMMLEPSGFTFKESTDFANFESLFQQGMQAEMSTTASVNAIYDAALQAKDYETCKLLKPFFVIQADEEAKYQCILDRIATRTEGGVLDGSAIHDLDEWL